MEMEKGAAVGLRWLPNYARAFGAGPGATLLARIALLDRADALEPRPIRVPGLGAVWLRARQRDHAIFQQVWVKCEYDLAGAAPAQWPRLWAAYEAMARPVILDAGAHIGLSVLWWSRLFPRAQIIAVEPSRSNLEVLRLNVRGHNVHVANAALTARDERLRLDIPGSGSSASRACSMGEGEEVATVTVERLMTQADSHELLLAKIDIEGGEESLFAENTGWMDRTHALAVEPHDWLWPGRATSRTLWRAVADRRFDVISSGENVLLFRA